MNRFMFEAHNTVLLLGEGNFSFSCCLLKIIEGRNVLKVFPNVVSTCFQKNELSETALENIKYLKDRGAVVFLGIDATNLENELKFKKLFFDKVIFNFPHVGGKMKINLNRQLLQDFFVSVSSILTPCGQVVVTLCSGQGGTEFEGVLRRWDDTWQVVEQAAYGDLVLVDIGYFPSAEFTDYKCVGYRGIEKSFNTDKAVVHVFKRAAPIVTELSDKIDLFRLVPVVGNDNILVSIAHRRAIDNNPLKIEKSPQSFLIEHVIKSFDCSVEHFTIVDDLPLYTEFNITQAYCRVNDIDCSLRNSLQQVIPESLYYNEDNYIIKGLVFSQLKSDFKNVANCEVVIKGCCEIMQTFLSNLILKLNLSKVKSFRKKDCWYLSCNNLKTLVAINHNNYNRATIYLDALASCVFSASYKEVWAKGCHVSGNTLSLPSLYPRSYYFDVSFLSKESLDMIKVINALHQLPEDIVEEAQLISCFEFDNCEKSYCFRIKYRSYTKPLFRKRAIEFHDCVMGTLMSHSLNLKVK